MATTSGSRVFGAKGMLQAHNRHLTTVAAWSAERTGATDPVQDFLAARYSEAYKAEIEHFVGCMEKGTKPLAGFRRGARGAAAGRCGAKKP